MRKDLVYSVIGTGAIGGYYGGRLAQNGKNVHFLFHRDYDYVKENGLQVNSINGSFHLDNVNAYDRASDMPKSDVILVCLKTTNNESLLPELLPSLLKEDSLVILIQNGIGVEEDVQAMFPSIQLAAGLAFICCAKTEPGLVNHQCYGYINIGNYSCKDKELFDTVIEDFKSAGIDAKEVEYNRARWSKAVWNMPFNGMTVALDTTTDKLLANDSTLPLIKDQMLEVIHAAKAVGVKGLEDDFADKMIYNTIHMTPYAPSMKLDWDFGRKMEIKYLYSKGISKAKEAGFSMPKLEMLESELLFMEANRK